MIKALYFILLLFISLCPAEFSIKVDTFTYNGLAFADQLGGATHLGDIDGDTIPDFMFITSQGIVSGATNQGQQYVIFGSHALDTAELNLINLNGTNGFTINGPEPGVRFGDNSGYIGDVDNDGYDDILGAAPVGFSSFSAIYIIYGGPPGTFSSAFSISDINGTNGFCFQNSIQSTGMGQRLPQFPGDFNNDGFKDILIPISSHNYIQDHVGTVFIFYGGSRSNFSSFGYGSPFNLGSFDPSYGAQLVGTDTDFNLGNGDTSFIGDLDGDGFDDLIVSSVGADEPPLSAVGKSFLVYGAASGTIDFPLHVQTANSSTVVKFIGLNQRDQIGIKASSVGDVNNDGFPDFAITSQTAGLNSSSELGRVSIIFGKPGRTIPDLTLGSLNSSFGVDFHGILGGDRIGSVVSAIGDFNGDSIDDIAFGSNVVTIGALDQCGAIIIVFGKSSFGYTSGGAQTLDLKDLDGTNGLVINGPQYAGWFGASLMGIGDVNSDGYADFVTSSTQANVNQSYSVGKGYLILGAPPTSSGKYRVLESNTFVNCPPGTYNSGPPIMAQCKPCSEGTYQPGSGASNCPFCEIGSFTGSPGQSECSLCPPGTYSSFSQQISNSTCFLCDPGFYSFYPGMTACTKCPRPQSECLLPGLTQPVPSPGYQLISGTIDEFASCIPPEACPGDALGKCSPGYSDPDNFCAVCDDGYFRLKGKCNKCPAISGASTLPLFAFLYIVFLIFLIPISSQGHRFGMTSMFASLLQTISLFGSIQLAAPQLWNDLFDVLSTALFTFEVAAPECANKDTGFLLTWYLQMFSPIISLFIYFLTYKIAKFFLKQLKPWADKQRPTGDWTPSFATLYFALLIQETSSKQLRAYVRSGAVFALTLLYTIVTKSAISVLDCVVLPNGEQLMQTYPVIHCNSPEWYPLAVLSYIFMIFFTFGFPAFVYFYVHRHARKGSLSEVKQLVYGVFLDKFQSRYSYWEAIGLLRKGIMILIIIPFSHEINTTIALLFILFVISLVIQNWFNPFWSIWLNRFELMVLFTSSMILILARFINDFPEYGNFISVLAIILLVFTFGIGFFFAYHHRKMFVEDRKRRQEQGPKPNIRSRIKSKIY